MNTEKAIVEISLGDQKLQLRPSHQAAAAISRQAGGLLAAVEAAGRFDIDVITGVIAIATDRDPQSIIEAVWTEGLPKVAPLVVKFLTTLANGGRPITAQTK